MIRRGFNSFTIKSIEGPRSYRNHNFNDQQESKAIMFNHGPLLAISQSASTQFTSLSSITVTLVRSMNQKIS